MGLSRLNYTPFSDLDYGSVSCWARNAINVQRSPCVFRIVAASRPFALQNCTTSNLSSDSLQVECVEGFDGGLPQGFLLELVEVPSLRLIRNMSALVRHSSFIAVTKQRVKFHPCVIMTGLTLCRISHAKDDVVSE